MSDMQISSSGLSFIAKNEGFSEVVYEDSAGLHSIGYGHKIVPSDGSLETVTTEYALTLLHRDVAHAVSCVNECVEVDLTQNQFDALVDLTYNIGGGNFQHSTLLKLLNNNQYTEASDQFLIWNKARINGILTEVDGLTHRRQAERTLFLTT